EVRDALERVRPPGTVVLFDTLTDDHLETIGRVVFELQQLEQKPLFVAGSSGVDYALARYWQSAGIAGTGKHAASHLPPVAAVDRTVVLSGSCSPVTERQIGWALEHGFADVEIEPSELTQPKQRETSVCELAKRIVSRLDAGHSVIVHTGRRRSIEV